MRIVKMFTTNNNVYKAYVNEYKVLGKATGKYTVTFEAYGEADREVRGADSLGMKVYDSLRKATNAGLYYIRKKEREL